MDGWMRWVGINHYRVCGTKGWKGVDWGWEIKVHEIYVKEGEEEKEEEEENEWEEEMILVFAGKEEVNCMSNQP